MKVILPLAGRGRRLIPHTNRVPKPLLLYEGKPILAHLLEPLQKLPVSEFIFLIGYQGTQIRAYMDANYNKLPVSFIEQIEQKGLGHAVSLASDCVSGEPVLIVLGDVIVELDWVTFSQNDSTTLAVRRMVDEKPYGIVELKHGIVESLVEKPRQTDLAIAGCYLIRESNLLFRCLHELIQAGHRTKAEYQLTDALQLMVTRGVQMRVQEVNLVDWENAYHTDAVQRVNAEY